MIVTIATLLALSNNNNGFTKASDRSLGSILSVSLDSSFLWTGLPPIIMAFFALAYGETVTAAANRQPYVELNHDAEAARNVRLTILLEYSGYAALYNWFVAFRNKHFHLGLAMFSQLIAALVLAPLASNVFTAKATDISQDVALFSPNRLDTTALRTANLQPALDIASAMLAYDASPPLWVQSNASVEPYYTQTKAQSSDIKLATFVSSTEPSCEIIDSASLNISFSNRSDAAVGSVVFDFTDRECNISGLEWPIGINRRMYSKTWSQTCASDQDPQDRVGIFAGIYSLESEYSLKNITMISCWPKYWNSSVDVTTTFTGSGPAQLKAVGSLSQNSSRLISLYFRSLHTNLQHYTLSAISDDLETDSFGNIVHSYAKKLAPDSEIDSTAYQHATSGAYSTLWAAVASTQLMRPLEPLREANGTLTTTTNRVHVVAPIAGVLLALLFLMTISTAMVLVHVLRTRSILSEEPQGILGRALVLLRSDVTPCLDGIRQVNPRKLKLLEFIKKNHNTEKSMCWYDWDFTGSSGKIRLRGLEAVVGPRPSWWRRMWTWLRPFGRRAAQNINVTAVPGASVPIVASVGGATVVPHKTW